MEIENAKPLVVAGFTMTGIKTWSSYDGGGYQASLRYKGKRVAVVTNDGHGGMTRYDWEGVTPNGEHVTDAKKAKITKEAQSVLSGIVGGDVTSLATSCDLDIAMGALMDHMDLVKAMKKMTAFRRPTDDPDSYSLIKAPFDQAVKDYINKTWPGSVILNEDPFA